MKTQGIKTLASSCCDATTTSSISRKFYWKIGEGGSCVTVWPVLLLYSVDSVLMAIRVACGVLPLPALTQTLPAAHPTAVLKVCSPQLASRACR